MKLMLIPAGSLEMGTDDGDDDEKPVHRVHITKPFYMGEFEVTLGQFLKFYHDVGYKTDAEKDGGGFGWDGLNFSKKREYVPWSWGNKVQTEQHPVVNVSWNDATTFCGWLSRKEGKTYRLPTEAEWEHSCRAGSTKSYSFGDDSAELDQNANFADAYFRVKDASTIVTGDDNDGWFGAFLSDCEQRLRRGDVIAGR